MQTHAGQLGLGFDLLTLWSVPAEVLPTSVLLAQSVFPLELIVTLD